MKKLVLAVCIAASFSAYGRSEKACRVYEFAELQTYTNTQLQDLNTKYKEMLERVSHMNSITAREVREDFDDQQNCREEIERISRLIEARKSTSPEKKSKKGKATSDKG
jgi:deoxyadenosine/deoxycytidine kinase